MNEQLKKIFLIGLGATVASKEKADQVLNDLSKSGSVAAEETKVFFEKLTEKGQSKKDHWQTDMKDGIKDALHDVGLTTDEEYLELKEKVETLEAKLANQTSKEASQKDEG
ncbi:MAG: phasin family protein [Sporolactobacillus sp.]